MEDSHELTFDERADRQVAYSVKILSEAGILPIVPDNKSLTNNYKKALNNIKENPPLDSEDILVKKIEQERDISFQNAIKELKKVCCYDAALAKLRHYNLSTSRKIGKNINEISQTFDKNKLTVRDDFLKSFNADAYYKTR